jgi:hypothetical protein
MKAWSVINNNRDDNDNRGRRGRLSGRWMRR